MRIVLHEEHEDPIYTVTLEQPPYNGDVEVDIRPKTRTMTERATKAAKRSPLNRRRTVVDDDGKKRVIDGDFAKAFEEELADLLIVDWRGIVDSQGKELECNRENKARFFRLDVANYLLQRASDIAVAESEADEKNFES